MKRVAGVLAGCLVAGLAVVALAGEPSPAAGNDAADLRLMRLLERARGPATDASVPSAPARQRMLVDGEAALARGEVDQALDWFERAGLVSHEADAELGLIRTYMQAGHYRRALAFAAHTAGAHPASGAGSALYAWLLHIGGQAQIAARLLNQALGRLPEDSILLAVQRQIKAPQVPVSELLVAPARFSPYSSALDALPKSAAVIASGILIDGGRKVLSDAAALGQVRNVWVRNGAGRTTVATVVRSFEEFGLVELQLASALEGAVPLAPPRDVFPGSPGFLVEFAPENDGAPAWPIMHVGFLGNPVGAPGVYRLGISVAAGHRGGPVFDAGGRLAGIALANATGGDRLVLTSRIQKFLEAPLRQSDAGPNERVPVDELYERALAVTVQVIATR